jgi:diguanylate cyclase (GGDEF)-like protein
MEREMRLNSGKTLNFKVSLFFVAISAVLVFVLTAISLYAFRQFSITTATAHLRTAAEIARVHLTEAMITGVIDQRQNFLLRLSEVQNLKNVRVTRAPVVDEQFGTARKGEYLPDELEKSVLKTGQPRFEVTTNNGEILFRGTIPYTANAEGSPNCLQCHLAKPGEVLGAITMTMSITALRHNGLVTVASIIGVVIFAILVLFVLLHTMLRPISNTASAIEHAVQDAIDGNFNNHIDKQTNDEIGQIANDTNRLLEFLNAGLNKINSYASQLVIRVQQPNENKLLATIDMVENMTHIAQYKTAIAEDKNKTDVYRRLISTINSRFFHEEGDFSIYEVSNDNNELSPVLINEETDTPCRWCHHKILSDAKGCRVVHTAHVINSITQPGICYNFKQPGDDNIKGNKGLSQPYQHVCFPILRSGTVGSVVQLVVRDKDKEHTLAVLPYILVYMNDTAPGLEVRRLLETLRESTLRDPMTGLNNRRFLEGYVDTLTASVRRKQMHVAVLMLDLDHFKMVNDTYGHDTGDAVLKTLANVIKATVRASDIVIRYGGEEFMVVLQETSGDNAVSVAEKIRMAVEIMPVTHGGVTLQKTISIGVADFPGDTNTFWQAVKFSDVALYHAKEAGRNRVMHFTSDMWLDNQEY